MSNRKVINLSEIDTVDFNQIPDGVNFVIDDDMRPVAVLMSAQYYEYIEQLMFKLKDKLIKK